MFSEWAEVPVGTRTIQVELKGTRNNGTDNDSYFDDLFLTLGSDLMECSQLTSVNNQFPRFIPELKIAPNPMTDYTSIKIPEASNENLFLSIIDMNGNKVNPAYQKDGDTFRIEKGNLSSGTYFVWLRDHKKIIGSGKIVILNK